MISYSFYNLEKIEKTKKLITTIKLKKKKKNDDEAIGKVDKND